MERPETRSLPSTEAGLVRITAVGLRCSSYQFIKEAAFSPSSPFLLSISGLVHGQTALCLFCGTGMEGGKRPEEGNVHQHLLGAELF